MQKRLYGSPSAFKRLSQALHGREHFPNPCYCVGAHVFALRQKKHVTEDGRQNLASNPMAIPCALLLGKGSHGAAVIDKRSD